MKKKKITTEFNSKFSKQKEETNIEKQNFRRKNKDPNFLETQQTRENPRIQTTTKIDKPGRQIKSEELFIIKSKPKIPNQMGTRKL